MAQIGEAKRALDPVHPFRGVFKAVTAELRLLDFLEFIAHLLDLASRQNALPCRKDHRVFAGGVVLIHPHKALERARQGLGIGGGHGAACGGAKNELRDLAPPLMLFQQGIDSARRGRNLRADGCRVTQIACPPRGRLDLDPTPPELLVIQFLVGSDFTNYREEFMEKFSAVGRALAVILAIVSAFVSNPIIAPLLILFGGIAAIGNTPERNSKNYLIAIVLVVGANVLEAVPYIGSYLVAVFTALGIAFVGASIIAITITLEQRIVRDWLTPSAKVRPVQPAL